MAKGRFEGLLERIVTKLTPTNMENELSLTTRDNLFFHPSRILDQAKSTKSGKFRLRIMMKRAYVFLEITGMFRTAADGLTDLITGQQLEAGTRRNAKTERVQHARDGN